MFKLFYILFSADAVDYCAANQIDIVPTPDNCAQYYNCSKKKTPIGDHVIECQYPDLFSSSSLSCQNFEAVNCSTKMVPQAPCTYYSVLIARIQ